MDGDLLLRASDCPGILDGWCGPVVVAMDDGPFAEAAYVQAVGTDGPLGTPWAMFRDSPHAPLPGVHDEDVFLPIARDEAADRAARWLAERCHLAKGCTPPWFRWIGEEWRLDGDEPREAGQRWHWRFSTISSIAEGHGHTRVPSLRDLDPADPRVLPGGARLVDRFALKLCCEHLGGRRG